MVPGANRKPRRLLPWAWLRPPKLVWTLSGAAVWTAALWGNRIWLITSAEAENPWAVARILGSLVAAALVAGVAWRLHRTGELARIDRALLLGFLLWNLIVWVPSALGVLTGDYSLPFQLVHGVLAGGSIAFGATAAAAAWRDGTSQSTTSTSIAENSTDR